MSYLYLTIIPFSICQDFDEFIALAREGDSDVLDSCTKDLVNEAVENREDKEQDLHNKEDIYAAIADNQTDANALVFAFGKAVDKKPSEFLKGILQDTCTCMYASNNIHVCRPIYTYMYIRIHA